MAKGNKFGAFEGVFTPSILTILGVIMYMRLPWIVGQGGLQLALGIIVIAHVISITTGLSVASISTDKSVQAGGPYYIISRSLGLPIGGTIGLALCVGLAFSISLYIIGFTESLLSWMEVPSTKDAIRWYGTITLVILTAITFISTALAIKSQFFILGAIVVSLIAILLGPSFVTLYNTGDALVSQSVHWSSLPGTDLGVLFAIFFPAVTGFTAGVNMSGDLANPRRAIPRGTIAAIGVGLVAYIGLAAFLAINVPADQLANNPDILLDIALHPGAVYAGIWGATLSSALGSILGAPRILQALSLDRITPSFLGRGHGKTNEPRTALLLVFCVALAGILVAELDVIAGVVSMFFIATYGFLNLVAAIENWANPDFRPDFRIPVWVPLLGLATCVLIMVKLDFAAMLGAVVLLTTLFLLLKRRELALETGDTWAGVWSSVIRSGLSRLDSKASNDRQWRPNILMFSDHDQGHREPMREFGASLVAQRGVLTDFELVHGSARSSRVMPPPDEDSARSTGMFYRRIETLERFETLQAICRYHGFPGLEPNTIMMPWGWHDADREGFQALVQRVDERDFNLILASPDAKRGFGKHQRIDVWLSPGRGTVPLSLNLVRFLTTSDQWRRTKVRFLIVNDEPGGADRLYATTQRLLDEARVVAGVKVINNAMGARPFEDWVREESADADLTVAALPRDLKESADEWFERTDGLLRRLGAALLIRGPRTVDDAASFGIRQAAPSTEAPVVMDQELRPLTLPDAPEAAAEVNRVSESLDALFEGFHERGLTEVYAVHASLVERVKSATERFFLQAGRALDIPNPQRRVKMLARARSTLIFRWRKLLEDFERNDLVSQRTTLRHAIDSLQSEAAAIKSGAPPLVLFRRPFDHLTTPLSQSVAQWGFETRVKLRARILRQSPEYGISMRPLLQWVSDHQVATHADDVLRTTAEDVYESTLELGRILETLRATLLRSEASEGPEALTARLQVDREAILGRLDALLERSRDRLVEHRNTLRTQSREIAQSLSDDLSRIDVIRFVARQRRVPRTSALLEGRLPDVAVVLTHNTASLLRRSVLALTISGIQQRFTALARRFESGVVARVNSGVLRQYEKLTETLQRFSDALREGKTAVLEPTPALPRPMDPKPFVEELLREIQSTLAETPETLATASDDAVGHLHDAPLDEVEESRLTVRRSVQFLLEAEFVGRLQRILEEVPAREQRAVDVAQDVLRLIQFNQSDFESWEAADDSAFVAQMEPVVDNGLTRVRGELETLTAQAPRLAEELERQLRFIIDRTDAYAVSASPRPLLRYTNAGDGQGVLSTVEQGTRRLSQAARSFLAQAIYRRSEGVLLARRLGNEEARLAAGAQSVDGVLTLTQGLKPTAPVLEALPFYYRQLFLGKSTFNKAFWVGRTEESARADRAVANFRAGFEGAILVVGERKSGKSALCHAIAANHFRADRVINIYPPPGGSIDPAVFEDRLARELDLTGNPADLLRSLPDQRVIVLHGLEAWWERSPDGCAALESIMALVEELSERHLFLLNMDVHAFRFVSQLIPLADKALAVIETGPIDARELGAIIALRHRSTGLRYEFGGRIEGSLPEWHRARLFAGLFDHTDGNVGAALQAWVAHIEDVRDDRLMIRRATRPDTEVLATLSVGSVALLVQLVLHRTVTHERLLRLSGLGEAALQVELRTLTRMGLLQSDTQGVVELDRFAHPTVVARLREAGVL